MRNKAVVFITVISILCMTPLIPANAAAKAGAKCSKVGLAEVVKNKSYTCTKLNKKLVWKLQVPKIEIIQPQEVQISIDNLDLNAVRQKAYDNVINVSKTRPRASFKPTLIVGPSVKQARIDQELLGLNRAIDLWAPDYIPEKFQIVYVDRGDENWLEQKSTELGLSAMLPPGQTWREQFTKYSDCPFAMAGSPNGIPTFVQCLGYSYGGGRRQNSPHEYTHLYQLKYDAWSISWYMEGSASFFGWTLGMYPFDPKATDRSNHLRDLFSQITEDAKSDFRSKDLERFKSRMKMLSGRNTQETASISYWVGGLATEVLVALYGFEKFGEFTKNMKNSQDVSFLLMQTYGLSADSFYEKLAPYVWGNL